MQASYTVNLYLMTLVSCVLYTDLNYLEHDKCYKWRRPSLTLSCYVRQQPYLNFPQISGTYHQLVSGHRFTPDSSVHGVIYRFIWWRLLTPPGIGFIWCMCMSICLLLKCVCLFITCTFAPFELVTEAFTVSGKQFVCVFVFLWVTVYSLHLHTVARQRMFSARALCAYPITPVVCWQFASGESFHCRSTFNIIGPV